MPVYGDYDATRACLESLLDELRSTGNRAILVNDATPDTRIEKYLTGLQSEACWTSSLTLAISVMWAPPTADLNLLNRATSFYSMLTRSFTPGFIDRLAAAAHSSSDIGTVMPLSNHGFPIPDGVSPIGARADVENIDAIAANVNAQKITDIPNGIGFCLYITRACLDLVGLLTEDFGLGYYEDADICLRARARGFRNVCAPSIYIGHAGSKSFGTKKRSLVMRNISIIDRRYPNQRAEWAAFTAADPLRGAREAIELKAAAVPSHPRLLVTGAGALGAIARERARNITSETPTVMILEVRRQCRRRKSQNNSRCGRHAPVGSI